MLIFTSSFFALKKTLKTRAYDGEDNDKLGHNVGIIYPETGNEKVIVDEEPLDLFSQRIQEFWKEINAMNYSRIAVVAHWVRARLCYF